MKNSVIVTCLLATGNNRDYMEIFTSCTGKSCGIDEFSKVPGSGDGK